MDLTPVKKRGQERERVRRTLGFGQSGAAPMEL